jgi:hypothetical protein
MLVMSLYIVVDTFWIAKISPQAIAALTICFLIQMIFGAFGVGTGVGASSFALLMCGTGFQNFCCNSAAGGTHHNADKHVQRFGKRNDLHGSTDDTSDSLYHPFHLSAACPFRIERSLDGPTGFKHNHIFIILYWTRKEYGLLKK